MTWSEQSLTEILNTEKIRHRLSAALMVALVAVLVTCAAAMGLGLVNPASASVDGGMPDHGTTTCTTNSGGYCTVNHQLGKPPADVTLTPVEPSRGFFSWDQATSSSFRVHVQRPITERGAYVGAVTFSYIVYPSIDSGTPTSTPPTTAVPTPTTAPPPTTPAPTTTAPPAALPHDPAFVPTSYWSAWPNTFPTDPSFFPVGPFNQTPQRTSTGATAADWKAWGANTFVALYHWGDSTCCGATWTEDALSAAKAQGMYVIGEARPDADSYPSGSAARGNLVQPDEPDGNGIAPVTFDANVQADGVADPQRPTYGNFTKGMVYSGSAASNQTYCAHLGITSTDIYGYTDPWEAGGPHSGGWVYGLGIDQQHRYCPGRPAWGFVETTQPFNTPNRITPTEAENAVFNILVHGGQGIEYFIHDFYSADEACCYTGEHALMVDPLAKPVKDKLASVNAWIKANAAKLNAPTVSGITVTSSNAIPGTALGKDVGGKLWLLAQADGDATHQLSGSATLSTSVPLADGTVLDVVGESRQVTVAAGKISDTFTAYQHHVYAQR